MSKETAEDLNASGYTLHAFQVVSTNDDGAMPTVWMSTKGYSLTTTLTWSDEIVAYSSTTAIAAGATVAVGFSVGIAPGQMLTIESGTGTGPVTADGLQDAVGVLNSSGQRFTVGVSASGKVQENEQAVMPLCAAALHGQDLKLFELTSKVLFVVSGSLATPGTIVSRSSGPGVMLDFSGAPGGERSLTYDSDAGWSWNEAAWAYGVPPGTDLKPLLTLRSERLRQLGQVRLKHFLARL
jgi:hypothetical protein